MPISEYFGGHGTEVMKELKAKHGEEAGERIFYATANKEGQKLAEDAAARHSRLHAALDRVMDAKQTDAMVTSVFPGEEGTEVIVEQTGAARFSVSLHDKDSGEKIQGRIYPTLEQAESAAKAMAAGRAADKNPDRSARLHRALDRMMDRCGYGKDAEEGTEGSTAREVMKEGNSWRVKRYVRGKGWVDVGPATSSEISRAQENLQGKSLTAKGTGQHGVRDTSDSAYSLTARDQGFLRSILEGATEAVRGGLGAMTPTGDAGKNTIEAYGVKGMNSTRWRREFKDYDELEKWAEKNDAEVQGVRDLEESK